MRLKARVSANGKLSHKFNPHKHFIVRACMWPKSRYKGGKANDPAGHTSAHNLEDLEEVKAYLLAHLNASVYDVALECHFSDGHARRLMKNAKKNV
jgi:hypothetical protein